MRVTWPRFNIQFCGLTISIYFIFFFTEIHVSNGESLTVNCTANALPPAQAKWRKPFDTQFEIVEGPMRIVEFDSSDEGIYECVLDNGIPPAAIRQVKLCARSVLS